MKGTHIIKKLEIWSEERSLSVSQWVHLLTDLSVALPRALARFLWVRKDHGLIQAKKAVGRSYLETFLVKRIDTGVFIDFGK